MNLTAARLPQPQRLDGRGVRVQQRAAAEAGRGGARVQRGGRRRQEEQAERHLPRRAGRPRDGAGVGPVRRL